MTTGVALGDMISTALNTPDQIDVIVPLYAAVMEAILLTDHPVLVAIDQANALFSPTMYQSPDDSEILPEQFAVMKPLIDLLRGVKTLVRFFILYNSILCRRKD